MIQFFLALFGLSAIFCTQHPNTKLRRYAPLFGLAGQPFWLWTTWHSQQWGIFVLCITYTVLWGMGLYTHWIKKKPVTSAEERLCSDCHVKMIQRPDNPTRNWICPKCHGQAFEYREYTKEEMAKVFDEMFQKIDDKYPDQWTNT
jgi:ribosomal protein L37AE/L43A